MCRAIFMVIRTDTPLIPLINKNKRMTIRIRSIDKLEQTLSTKLIVRNVFPMKSSPLNSSPICARQPQIRLRMPNDSVFGGPLAKFVYFNFTCVVIFSEIRQFQCLLVSPNVAQKNLGKKNNFLSLSTTQNSFKSLAYAT